MFLNKRGHIGLFYFNIRLPNLGNPLYSTFSANFKTTTYCITIKNSKSHLRFLFVCDCIYCCSQLPMKNSLDLIEEKTTADASIERIIPSALRFDRQNQ